MSNFRYSRSAYKPRERGLFVWVAVALGLVAIDFITRQWCFALPCSGNWLGVFGLYPYRNAWFVFSWRVAPAYMYALYTLLLSGIGVYIYRSWPELRTAERAAWVLVVSGATANIGERLYSGSVRDFIRIGNGYINLADVWILLGIACLFLLSCKKPGLPPGGL